MDRNTESTQPRDERILRITEILLFVVLTAIIIYQVAFGAGFGGGDRFLEVKEPEDKKEQTSVHSVSLQK